MINKFVAGLTAMALCVATQGCFCGSIRTHATVSTQDYGGNIFTKYRYRIIEVKGSLHHAGYGFWRGVDLDDIAIASELKTKYPNVFSDS